MNPKLFIRIHLNNTFVCFRYKYIIILNSFDIMIKIFFTFYFYYNYVSKPLTIIFVQNEGLISKFILIKPEENLTLHGINQDFSINP